MAIGLIGAGLGAKELLKDNSTRDPYGTLNPEQINTSKALGLQINNRLSQSPDSYRYQGLMNAPIGQQEQQAINDYGNLSSSTYDPNTFNNQFQSEVADPAYADFQRNIAPQLLESIPSFATARGTVLAKGLSNLQGQLLNQKFSTRQAALDRQANIARENVNVQAIPRTIQQAGLDRAYLDYTQGNQQHQQDINNALQFLGIGTVTEKQDNTLDRLIALASAGGQLAAAGAGGK
jgi:hypothetical protein